MADDSVDPLRPYLLPNEDVELICRTQSGFIILSNRRLVLLKEEKRETHRIEKAIPFDCISNIKQKKTDRFEISCETKSFVVRAPRDGHEEFQSKMSQCIDVIEGIRRSERKPSHIDYSYLEHLPASLIQNGLLDLNTILRDQPIHDRLVHEAEEFLGAEPFILEESLRHGNDKENGILLAVGTGGYFWIKGKKTGRFMSDVVVDTVEWENIRSLSSRWAAENALIEVTYSLTSDGKASTAQYQWYPLVNDETLQYPWLLQQMNGPWILADIFNKFKKEGENFHSL